MLPGGQCQEHNRILPVQSGNVQIVMFRPDYHETAEKVLFARQMSVRFGYVAPHATEPMAAIFSAVTNAASDCLLPFLISDSAV